MCFSSTASFIASAALSALAAATISEAARSKNPRTLVFASFPAFFAAQQFTEGVVWLSFDSSLIHTVATHLYVLFSQVVWPIMAPVAVLLLERDARRKIILRVFLCLGIAISSYLLYLIVSEPVVSQITAHSIAYCSSHLRMDSYAIPALICYVIATCGSCMVSSNRVISIFGIILLASLAVALWFFVKTFTSVWCFFAALLSFVVYVHFAHKRKNELVRIYGQLQP